MEGSEAAARPSVACLADGRIAVVFAASDPDPEKAHPAWPYITGTFIGLNIIEERE